MINILKAKNDDDHDNNSNNNNNNNNIIKMSVQCQHNMQPSA